MNKEWFPFFSMMFWFVTKAIGLSMVLVGVTSLAGMFAVGFNFWQLVLAVLVPVALGWFLLVTDMVFDMATAEQRRRQGAK